MNRLLRFALGLYTRDVTTRSENAAARISFMAGLLSTALAVTGFVFLSSSSLVFAAVLGGVAVGFGISGLIHRTSLLATKYAGYPNAGSLRLGYKKSYAGIILGMIGVGTGIYFY